MKNITVSVPDELDRKAQIHAAEPELSLVERKKAFFARIRGIRVADVPSRDEIYESRFRKSK